MSGLKFTALSVRCRGAANVSCRDVACLSVHFDAVPARNGDLKLHPELSVSGARGLLRKHAEDFPSRGTRLCLDRVSIKESFPGGAARLPCALCHVAPEA